MAHISKQRGNEYTISENIDTFIIASLSAYSTPFAPPTSDESTWDESDDCHRETNRHPPMPVTRPVRPHCTELRPLESLRACRVASTWLYRANGVRAGIVALPPRRNLGSETALGIGRIEGNFQVHLLLRESNCNPGVEIDLFESECCWWWWSPSASLSGTAFPDREYPTVSCKSLFWV